MSSLGPSHCPYSPECVEGFFSEVRRHCVLGRSYRSTVRGELGGLTETPVEVLYPLLGPIPCRAYLRLLETLSSPWEPSLRFLRK
jgi:hypothetical protein